LTHINIKQKKEKKSNIAKEVSHMKRELIVVERSNLAFVFLSLVVFRLLFRGSLHKTLYVTPCSIVDFTACPRGRQQQRWKREHFRRKMGRQFLGRRLRSLRGGRGRRGRGWRSKWRAVSYANAIERAINRIGGGVWDFVSEWKRECAKREMKG
jgi:hypothetical protein